VRFERELSQSNRREILMQAARHLPMQCRTLTGGELLAADTSGDLHYHDCLPHEEVHLLVQLINGRPECRTIQK